MKKTLITVPMKDPSASKTRLSGALRDDERERLACLLYQRTLSFLGPIGAQTGAGLSVVTQSPVAAKLAEAEGFMVIHEPPESFLSNAASIASQWAIDSGYQRLCIIHADLAVPLKQDIIDLLNCEADVAICPSLDQGTNVLLVSPPDAIEFCYGRDSALRHMREAEKQDLTAVWMSFDSLSFDIDTSECLSRAVEQLPEFAEIRS